MVTTGPAEEMEVCALEGDYGLPSMDVSSIRLILYLRFSRAPFRLTKGKFGLPPWHLSGPVLRCEGFVISNYSKCVEHLRLSRYSLELGHSSRSSSEVYAYTAYVLRTLGPILEYVAWINERNFEDLTRPWHAKILPPFVSSIYVQQRRQRAYQLVCAHENVQLDDGDDFMRNCLKKNADECFDLLATRLGKKQYFFGDHPCAMDCAVYAFLAPLLKIPYPCEDVHGSLKTRANLVEYILRIDGHYQPDLLDTTSRVLAVKHADEDDESSTLTLKLFTTAFVVCAMLGYAVSTNIIHIT